MGVGIGRVQRRNIDRGRNVALLVAVRNGDEGLEERLCVVRVLEELQPVEADAGRQRGEEDLHRRESARDERELDEGDLRLQPPSNRVRVAEHPCIDEGAGQC